MSALTEQLSLRLSIEQREHLKEMARRMSMNTPPVKVTEADAIRTLIERDLIRANIIGSLETSA